MDRGKVIILLCLGLSILLYINCYAEEEKIVPFQKKNTLQACIDNLDTDSIYAVENLIRPEDRMPLINYACCKAVIKDDINECNKLKSPEKESCLNQYYKEEFFIGLALNNEKNIDLLRKCTKVNSADNSACNKFIGGFIKKDISICKDLQKSLFPSEKNCQAFIMLDVNLTDDQHTKDVINFIAAIQNFEIKECKDIKDNILNIHCNGYLSSNEKVCGQEKDFMNFKKRYCRDKERSVIK